MSQEKRKIVEREAEGEKWRKAAGERKKEERDDKKVKIKGAMVERKEEKRWLHEVRETTSDTTVIPLVWWVRERGRESVSVCSVMKESKAAVDCFCVMSLTGFDYLTFTLTVWGFSVRVCVCVSSYDGLLLLTPPTAERPRPQIVRYEQWLYQPSDFWWFSDIRGASEFELTFSLIIRTFIFYFYIKPV